MNSTNIVGIRIAGITLIFVVLLFGLWKGAVSIISQASKEPLATPIPSPEELIQQPTAATTLPPELQQQISSYKASAEESLGAYTKKYIESLPKDSAKNEVLSSKKVEEFVNTSRETLLPELFAGTVQTTATSGKDAIQAYLDAISPTHNSALNTITGDMITTAHNKEQSKEDEQALKTIHASIESNFAIFKKVKAPKEAVALHTKLLQATLALMNNVQLLENTPNDFVGGLIGQKNIGDLNAVFADIGNQIIALETKYNIK